MKKAATKAVARKAVVKKAAAEVGQQGRRPAGPGKKGRK